MWCRRRCREARGVHAASTIEVTKALRAKRLGISCVPPPEGRTANSVRARRAQPSGALHAAKPRTLKRRERCGPQSPGARRSRRRKLRLEKCARIIPGLLTFLRPEGRAPLYGRCARRGLAARMSRRLKAGLRTGWGKSRSVWTPQKAVLKDTALQTLRADSGNGWIQPAGYSESLISLCSRDSEQDGDTARPPSGASPRQPNLAR